MHGGWCLYYSSTAARRNLVLYLVQSSGKIEKNSHGEGACSMHGGWCLYYSSTAVKINLVLYLVQSSGKIEKNSHGEGACSIHGGWCLYFSSTAARRNLVLYLVQSSGKINDRRSVCFSAVLVPTSAPANQSPRMARPGSTIRCDDYMLRQSTAFWINLIRGRS